MTPTIHPGALQSLIDGDHGAPFDVLGPHAHDEGVTIRMIRPWARSVFVINEDTEDRVEMPRVHDIGIFEVNVPGSWPGLRYRFEAETYDDQLESFHDPYAYPPLLSDYDLYLFSQGKHLHVYHKLGAQLHEVDGVSGVNFAVWAPNAYRVGVIGDFNRWDVRAHPMRSHEDSGIWELFIPDLQPGTIYKFEVRSRFHGYRAEKSDPYGFYGELRPRTASIVTDLSSYKWGDDTWMKRREDDDPLKKPMSIYEVHLGSWRRDTNNHWLNYREMAHALVEYARMMGYTHLELMPVAEHPFDESWGYQVTGYFAPTSRYGTPEDFIYFVDHCHQNGIGVILDWVPAHFPKDGHGLSYFDGTHLYEHADLRQGEHPDWGTYIFNYGRNEVRNFLLANALFWLDKYHIDGLRVDAVSSMLYLDFGRKDGEWIPNQYGGNENLDAVSFLKEFNQVVHREYPGAMTIAEESTAWPMVSRPTYLGGLGFTFKWNMGWMHDTLAYLQEDSVYRRYAHNKLTFSMMYAFSENFVLSLSHDEVVHGKGSMINKMFGDWWQKFASLRLLSGYQITHPGKKLIFMGHEFGQWREWSEERSLDWQLIEWDTHGALQRWMQDLNRFYQTQPALYELDFDRRGFSWIEANDADQSVFTYIRYADDSDNFLVVACNFTPVPRHDYRIGVPKPGHYTELLNSDSAYYGGSNIGNDGGRTAEPLAWHDFGYSINLTLPPLGIIVLKRDHK